MINLIGLFLLGLTAEVFVAKSFIKPFIPIFGKFIVAKNVSPICFIGAIIYTIGSLMFSAYTALGIVNIQLTGIIYLLLFIGSFMYSFTLFKHYTKSTGHSILLCLFGGWMFILGKKTKAIFGGLFHQMWDFEYQGTSSSDNAQQEQVDINNNTNNEQQEQTLAQETSNDIGEELFPGTDEALEVQKQEEQPIIDEEPVIQQEENIEVEEQPKQPKKKEPVVDPEDGAINLEEGFDI